MRTQKQIISEAISQYNPVKVLLLFSGGHDSLVSTHSSAQILNELGIDFSVYHGDTTIGIKETQEFVIEVCDQFNWELAIRKAPKTTDHYESIVREHGFPGSTKSAHRFCYLRLKERALRHYVTHECKSSPYARENVLLLTGVRKSESLIRMGYTETTTKDNSRIWCNPIFYWTESDCEQYMKDNDLPRNPVKDKICISGECLCGAFGGKEELAEIRGAYPEAAEEIDRLHKIAIENGKPWPWSDGPNNWYKNNPPGQLDMFMCVGCEEKREKVIIQN